MGLAVLIALIAGTELAGVVGALVAIPTAALIAVLIEEYLIQKDAAEAAQAAAEAATSTTPIGRQPASAHAEASASSAAESAAEASESACHGLADKSLKPSPLPLATFPRETSSCM